LLDPAQLGDTVFGRGEVVDDKYLVMGICNSGGGMGEILHVTQLAGAPPFPLVLKYCKVTEEEQLKRFRREVRLLNGFKSNSKVVQIWDQNLESDPPYFVMKFYTDGDLTTISHELTSSYERQEACFLKMIDCIQELHTRTEFHRDIKPQNFLRDGAELVVSDLGLSTEVSSPTAFTRSSLAWGTHGYIPPEFLNGGFKHADAAGDIYMLGKTFYVLLTGRDPAFLMPDGVEPPLFHVINRCCSLSKSARYQSLAELRQALVTSYDVLLNRAGGVLQELFSAIRDRLATSNQYDTEEVSRFVEQLAMANEDEQRQVFNELPDQFFSAISQEPVADKLEPFLRVFEAFVDGRSYSFGHAETIASRMNRIVKTPTVPPEIRALALDLAIRAACYMNRFAAMDTCKAMVRAISDHDLALNVVPVILREEAFFLADIEPSTCSDEAIRNAIRSIKKRKE
jgi:serine/threonine protein kinase